MSFRGGWNWPAEGPHYGAGSRGCCCVSPVVWALPPNSAAVMSPVWMSHLFPATFIKYPRSALFPSDWAVADVAELSVVYQMVRGIPENVPLAHSSHRCTLPPAASSLLMVICFTLDSLLPLCLSNKTLTMANSVRKWAELRIQVSFLSLPVI